MGNPAKTAILLFVLIFIIIAFFALTGVDPRTPEQSAIKLADQLGRLNRTINQMIRNFFYSIRLWFKETFSGQILFPNNPWWV
jgi:hypothetical protein